MTEPINILFGSLTTTTTFEDGSAQQAVIKTQHGAVVSSTRRISETVKIDSQAQVLAEFISLMESVTADSGKFDPEFTCVSDRKTGRIYKAYKSWSEAV